MANQNPLYAGVHTHSLFGPTGALGEAGPTLPLTTSQRLLDEKLRETLGDPLSFWTLLLNELQQGAGLTPDTTAKLREIAETRVADYVMKKLHDEDQSKREAQRMRDEAEKARQAAQYQSLVDAQRLAGISPPRYAAKYFELIEAADKAGIKDSKSRSMFAKLFGGG